MTTDRPLARFARTRSHRIVAFAAVGGLCGLAVGLAVLWPLLASLFDPGRFAGFQFTWPHIRAALLIDILPTTLTVLVAGAVGALAYATITLVATLLIPRRHAPLFDGMLLVVSLALVAETVGLSRAVAAAGLPQVTPGLLVIALFWSLSNFIWKRLPFGLTLDDSARTDLPLAPDAALPRLARIFDNAPPAAGSAELTRPAAGSLEIRQTMPGRHGSTVDMTFLLTETDPGRSDLSLIVRASGLSPLTWWDFRTRPFAEDYLEHIQAELTGRRDRSTNGLLIRRARRRMARRAA